MMPMIQGSAALLEATSMHVILQDLVSRSDLHWTIGRLASSPSVYDWWQAYSIFVIAFVSKLYPAL